MYRSIVGLFLLLSVSQGARAVEKAGEIPVAPESGHTVTAAPAGIQLYTAPASDLAAPTAAEAAPGQERSSDAHVNEILTVLFEHGLGDHAGTSAAKNEAQLAQKVAVTVMAIEPNGVVKIEGCSQRIVGNDVCEWTLTGKVKPKSIGLDRQVRSDEIAELRVAQSKAPKHDGVAVQVGQTPEDVLPHPVRLAAAESPVLPQVAVLQQKLADMAKLQEEIRQLRRETGTVQQFVVHVQLLEVSLTEMRKLGLKVPSQASGSLNGAELTRFLSQVKTTKSIPSAPGTPDVHAKGETSVIDWLVKNNLGKILSDPNIVVCDGRPASFSVGGEFPLPAKDGSKTVEYKPYGTQIDLLATSLGDDRVRLELRTRISELDDTRTVPIYGFPCPALDVSQTDTAVEASLGKPTALMGMIQKVAVAMETPTGVRDETEETCAMLVATVESVESDASAPRRAKAGLPK